MTPTRIRALVTVAAITAVVGWGAARALEGSSGRAIPVPWLAAATLWILAVCLVLWGLSCRGRLPHRTPRTGAVGTAGRPPLHPIVAARTAALAMAASRVGAAVGGLYVGISIALVSLTTQAARASLWAALGAAAASAVITVAAYWLEAMCRLPDDTENGPVAR